MVATGQLPDTDGLGLECTGLITEVGRASNLKVNDRVCAMALSSYATHVRASESFVSPIPDSMSSNIAASIPLVFTTAYYRIHYAARLQKGESILIHSAAGGFGQVCIQLARLVGVEVFVTASTSKVPFLQKTCGLPRDHIFNSRTLHFGQQIRAMTEEKGVVNVIINSLAGFALRESWRLMNMFGRFIGLGKKDAVENARLDMAPFERSASFIYVGWDHSGRHRTAFLGSVLKTVMSHFSSGTLTPLEPVTAFTMSEVEQTFRSMASGNHTGEIVVIADRDCLMKVKWYGKAFENLLMSSP